MKKEKPQTTEEWMEVLIPLVQAIKDYLVKEEKPRLADIGLINTRDLCLMLGVTPKTVANWRKKKELRFTKKGNRYFYLLSDVKDMMYEGFDRK